MTVIASATGRAFNAGQVVQHTLSALRSHWRAVTPLMAALAGLPLLLSNAGLYLTEQPGVVGLVAREMNGLSGILAITIAQTLLGAFGLALVTQILVSEETRRHGLRVSDPTVAQRLISATFLMSAGLLLAALALLIPAVWLSIVWVAVIPVLTVEDVTVRSAFGRSAELTRGHRWTLLGLALLLWLPMLVLGVVLGRLLAPDLPLERAAEAPVYGLVVQPLLATIFQMVLSVGSAVLYLELVLAKDGGLPGTTAEVFA